MSPLLFRLTGSLALTSACGLALSACDTGLETEAAQPASPTAPAAPGSPSSRTVAPSPMSTPSSPSSTPGATSGTSAAALPSQSELDAEAARITAENADAEYQRLKQELDGDS